MEQPVLSATELRVIVAVIGVLVLALIYFFGRPRRPGQGERRAAKRAEDTRIEPTFGDVEAAGAADGIDEAVGAGLLIADHARLRFAHPLFASSAYSLLGPRGRRALHRRLAEVVGEDEERARHMALGADGPSAEVAEALHEAAQQAAGRGAIGTAAELAEFDDGSSAPADRVGRERQRERHSVRLAQRLAVAHDAVVPRRSLDSEAHGPRADG